MFTVWGLSRTIITFRGKVDVDEGVCVKVGVCVGVSVGVCVAVAVLESTLLNE